MNLKPSEAAKKLNVSVKTLQRWDREGILKAFRTPTKRRYYTEEQIYNMLEVNNGEVFSDKEFSIEELVLEALHLNIGEHIDIQSNEDDSAQIFCISCAYLLGSNILVIGLYGFPFTMKVMSQNEDDTNYITVESVREYFKEYQENESNLSWVK